MRSRRPASSARTWFVCRRLRFRLVAFLVRMWLRFAWPHLYLPEAVLRNRFAAPRWVLILGIGMSFRSLVRAWAVVPAHHAFRPAWPVLGRRSPGVRRRVLSPAPMDLARGAGNYAGKPGRNPANPAALPFSRQREKVARSAG